MLTPLRRKRPALKAIYIDNTSKNYSQHPIHPSNCSKNQSPIFRSTNTKKKKSCSKKNKWSRKPTLGSDHSHLTMDFFMSNNYWEDFKQEDRIFALLFWTTRSNNHSLREIQQDVKKILGISFYRRTLSAFFKELEAQCFIKKHSRYRPEKMAHRRNYYELTVKGKAYMAALISFAITGIMEKNVVAPELKICGTIVKNTKTFMTRDWNRLRSDNSLSGKYIKKLYHHNRNSYFVRIQEKCQAYRWDFSFEVIKNSSDWLLFVRFRFNVDPPKQRKKTISEPQNQNQRSFHPWFSQISLNEKSVRKHKHHASFKKFGYKKEFQSATDISRNFWAKQPTDLIEKSLKLTKQKTAKNFRYRSFEKFLCHLLKTESKTFHSMRSQLLRSAVDGNKTRLDEGADTREIVEKMRQLEKETKQKISEKNLERFMIHPTHLLKRSLEAVEYRMKGITPKDKNLKGETDTQKQKTPIFEMRLVNKKVEIYNPKTGKDEFREKKEKVPVVVGYKKTLSSIERKCRIKNPVRSWVALLNYAIKLGSIEAVNEKFFKKKLN